jgi:peptide chain release factor subunit 3
MYQVRDHKTKKVGSTGDLYEVLIELTQTCSSLRSSDLMSSSELTMFLEQIAAELKRMELEEKQDVMDTTALPEVDDLREHINIVFIGHVDAGKSTISGQILYE